MLEIFIKHQKIILRSLGVLMLLIGFVIHFWTVPQEGLSREQIAAANVARMEASVAGQNSGSKKQADSTEFLKELKNTQEKQMQYLTIIALIFGVGFLGYSFIGKKET